MNVGDILVEDGELAKMHEIHEVSHFDFPFPDFVGNPRFCLKRSVRHDGLFMAAVLAKFDLECMLYLDHSAATPQLRLEALKLLHLDLIRQAKMLGLDSMYCVVVPEIQKSFGRRLEEHGWTRDRGWPKYIYHLQ